MSKVAVIDTEKRPLEPCHPAVARRLLKQGEAAIWRRYPFTIILKKAVPKEEVVTKSYTLSWDPGSRTSGIAVVSESGDIVYAAELHHRGQQIKRNLQERSGFRRGRRTRNLRHRPARWANRSRKSPVLEDNVWKYKRADDEQDTSKDSSRTKNKFVRVSRAQLQDKRYRWTRIANRVRKKFTPEMTNAELGSLTKDELIHHVLIRIKNANRDELQSKTQGYLRDLLKSKLKNIPPTRYRWKRERIGHKHRAENGWVAPSLMSRVFNLETWTRRLCKVYPISQLAIEENKFDLQLLENPDIHGIEYQQGTLHGREIREYLLELTGRKCAYCGKKHTRLHVEHIIPKAVRVDNRPSNLTMACKDCNEKKGKLHGPELEEKLGPDFAKKVKSAARKSEQGLGLSDAAAINTIRWKLFETLKATGLPVISGTGGKTAYHRSRAGLPKTHYYDAASVAAVPKQPKSLQVAIIEAKGHGRRVNLEYTFGCSPPKPGKKPKFPGFRQKSLTLSHTNGFAKFDHVEMVKKNGTKYKGVIRNFDTTPTGKPQKLRVEYFAPEVKDSRKTGNITEIHRLQKRDGYSYGMIRASSEFRPCLEPTPVPDETNTEHYATFEQLTLW